jgi:hypothetical protein
MANEMKNWENGQPSAGVEVSANDSGVMKYWADGQPSKFLFPAGTPPVVDNSGFFMFFQ